MGQVVAKSGKSATDSLSIGQVLPHALCDSKGELLLPTGQQVTGEFLNRLKRSQISEVYLVEHRPNGKALAGTPPDPLAILPYDSLALQRLEVYYDDMVASVSDFAKRLSQGQKTRIDEFEEAVDNYLSLLVKDRGVVLASCAGIDPLSDQSHDAILARRSVLMSIMATAVATQIGMDSVDCRAAGIAAAIHDVSLFGELPGISKQRYLDHPIRSALSLADTFGITPQLKIIIGQVHEQCDGSGFPRGLTQQRLHPVSRILNLVDAYLTLIEPHGADHKCFAPSDAVAYLVQQAIYGYFDPECVRGLLATASVYPVGSQVRLDDSSTATVLRSTGASYLEPVVQLHDAAKTIIDLRFSARIIIAPIDDSNRYRRLSKTILDNVLWTFAA